MRSPPHAIEIGFGARFGAATASAEPGDSPEPDEASEAATSSATATAVRVVPMRRIAAEFAARRGEPSYQAWSVPQCGQPTEVVTSAVKT